MFDVKVLKRGCPSNMALSGKYRDLVTPSGGVGGYGGLVKSGHPNLQIISLMCVFRQSLSWPYAVHKSSTPHILPIYTTFSI